jgi:tripartite-type tricarboxylate transporter receptor subunit TctC
MTMETILRSILATMLMLSFSPTAKAESSVESFYRGKTISIITPYPPDGSYDRYSRLAAQYMGKYIPGSPTIIVQNKSGVAGTLRSFVSSSADDGTAMGLFPETIAILQVTDPARAPWDVRELTYVGSFANVNTAFLLRKNARAKTIEDFKTIETNVGCNSPIGQSYNFPKLLNNLVGYKFKIICGYKGNAGMLVALERGEIDLTSGNWAGWENRAGVKDGTFKVVIQSGLKRHPDLSTVPLMQDLVPDPIDKKVIEFWSAGSGIGRGLLVRKAVPKDRVAALRFAFDKAMRDPDLLAATAKTNLEIDPTPGSEVQRISLAILDAPKDIVKLAIKAVQ